MPATERAAQVFRFFLGDLDMATDNSDRRGRASGKDGTQESELNAVDGIAVIVMS